MAKKVRGAAYPDTYGTPTQALPDVLGPLNIDQEGDQFVPPNDMAEVATPWSKGTKPNDPLALIKGLDDQK